MTIYRHFVLLVFGIVYLTYVGEAKLTIAECLNLGEKDSNDLIEADGNSAFQNLIQKMITGLSRTATLDSFLRTLDVFEGIAKSTLWIIRKDDEAIRIIRIFRKVTLEKCMVADPTTLAPVIDYTKDVKKCVEALKNINFNTISSDYELTKLIDNTISEGQAAMTMSALFNVLMRQKGELWAKYSSKSVKKLTYTDDIITKMMQLVLTRKCLESPSKNTVKSTSKTVTDTIKTTYKTTTDSPVVALKDCIEISEERNAGLISSIQTKPVLRYFSYLIDDLLKAKSLAKYNHLLADYLKHLEYDLSGTGEVEKMKKILEDFVRVSNSNCALQGPTMPSQPQHTTTYISPNEDERCDQKIATNISQILSTMNRKFLKNYLTTSLTMLSQRDPSDILRAIDKAIEAVKYTLGWTRETYNITKIYGRYRGLVEDICITKLSTTVSPSALPLIFPNKTDEYNADVYSCLLNLYQSRSGIPQDSDIKDFVDTLWLTQWIKVTDMSALLRAVQEGQDKAFDKFWTKSMRLLDQLDEFLTHMLRSIRSKKCISGTTNNSANRTTPRTAVLTTAKPMQSIDNFPNKTDEYNYEVYFCLRRLYNQKINSSDIPKNEAMRQFLITSWFKSWIRAKDIRKLNNLVRASRRNAFDQFWNLPMRLSDQLDALLTHLMQSIRSRECLNDMPTTTSAYQVITTIDYGNLSCIELARAKTADMVQGLANQNAINYITKQLQLLSSYTGKRQLLEKLQKMAADAKWKLMLNRELNQVLAIIDVYQKAVANTCPFIEPTTTKPDYSDLSCIELARAKTEYMVRGLSNANAIEYVTKQLTPLSSYTGQHQLLKALLSIYSDAKWKLMINRERSQVLAIIEVYQHEVAKSCPIIEPSTTKPTPGNVVGCVKLAEAKSVQVFTTMNSEKIIEFLTDAIMHLTTSTSVAQFKQILQKYQDDMSSIAAYTRDFAEAKRIFEELSKAANNNCEVDSVTPEPPKDTEGSRCNALSLQRTTPTIASIGNKYVRDTVKKTLAELDGISTRSEYLKKLDKWRGQANFMFWLWPNDLKKVKQILSTYETIAKTECFTNETVNGGFGNWSAYGPCSATCGAGTTQRSRKCDAPRPTNWGEDCAGNRTQSKACNLKDCPTGVNGGFGPWSTYGPCSVTCGPGSRQRRRKCDTPYPAYGGVDCIGKRIESRACNEKDCPTPVDGGFGQWSTYGPCSTTCGPGSRQRSRKCNTPYPAYGGVDCTGKRIESRACNEKDCPTAVDGGFGQWSPYGPCSATCGPGSRERSRKCDTPSPAYGGVDCTGKPVESEACNLKDCLIAVNGGFGKWSSYGPCSATCGTGTTQRSRKCDAPPPAKGGANCGGNRIESKACNLKDCPIVVNGGFGKWSSYGPCSATCGTGTTQRSRKCDAPPPTNGGDECAGNRVELKACNLKDCSNKKPCQAAKLINAAVQCTEAGDYVSKQCLSSGECKCVAADTGLEVKKLTTSSDSCETVTTKSVEITLSFAGDYEEVKDNAKFKKAVIDTIAQSAQIDKKYVSILRIYAGSIKTDFIISSTENANFNIQGAVENIKSAVASNAVAVTFNGKTLQAPADQELAIKSGEVSKVGAITSDEKTSSESSSGGVNTGMIGGLAAAAVCFILGLAVGVYCVKRRAARTKLSSAGSVYSQGTSGYENQVYDGESTYDNLS